MTLKTRLSLPIVLLVAIIVTGISIYSLHSLTLAKFEDVQGRAEFAAQQVQSYLIDRLQAETALYQPPPATLEETIIVWEQIIRGDPNLSSLLVQTMASTQRFIVEILVTDNKGIILTSSNPNQSGRRVAEYRRFEDWENQGPFSQLRELFTSRVDYETPIALGVGGEPIFTVSVIVSPVLLRETVRPALQALLVACLISLALALMLAIFVSNLALRPINRISQMLDRISRGEERSPEEKQEDAREVAAVESKLNLLGQQYQGAKEDASQLRSHVDQMLERLEEGVILFDRTGRAVMAGGAAERFLGIGRWLIMGRAVQELFPQNTPLGAAIQGAVQVRHNVRDCLVTHSRDGAAPMRLLANVEVISGYPGSEHLGTLVTLRDAETRRQIESHLDISSRLAAINRLTGGVAHEIKNPLNAIMLHLEILKGRLAEEMDETPQEITVISSEISRLNRVVKTFLDFTRPLDLKMDEVNLLEVVHEVANLLGGQAAMNNVAVQVEAGLGSATVRGDRDLLKQALLNVAVNGVEAMKQGGSLRICVEQRGTDFLLEIQDEGGGIPPEIQSKIFNLYFTTKEKGSGIGLAMTFRVVQLHNATMDFISEAGKGTRFRLRFPAAVENGDLTPSHEDGTALSKVEA